MIGLEIQNCGFEEVNGFDIMFNRNAFGVYISGQANKIKVPAS